jgi:hypothetical protein
MHSPAASGDTFARHEALELGAKEEESGGGILCERLGLTCLG